jgi:GNAT acetyltransferase-like protein
MRIRFVAVPEPPPSLLAEAASLAPASPFATTAYVECRRGLRERLWALCVEEGSSLVSACVAFGRSGYLNRSLEIPSLPELPYAEPFWQGLHQFCGQHRISHLAVNSFASATARIPHLPGEQRRVQRCEHLLDLQAGDLWARLNTHHRRNISRARNHGLRIRRATDESACRVHIRMLHASMQRRAGRGESVAADFREDEFVAMTRSGAGELFQAERDREVLSSMLILRAACGGYLQTAGTSPAGMACGASHFVVGEVASTLKSEGMQLLNLGGAGEENPGLQRFKAGFGTRTIELEAAEFCFASPLKRALSHAARQLRRHSGR